MSYFYGPVISRRLGFSLGVDLLPKKICTFDCLYCQVGRTVRKTIRRFSYVDLGKLKKELRGIIEKNPKIDYITISGSGEPTLHKNLDRIIMEIKKIVKDKLPVCVITNSSLLYRKDIRGELINADLIIPSLDAATSYTFNKINRPHRKVTFNRIIEGLIKLRKEFKGKIWLEIMLVKGVNDSLKEMRQFKKIVEMIKPDKIQINLPVRPTAEKVSLPLPERIRKIEKMLGHKGKAVTAAKMQKQRIFYKNIKAYILEFLKRRPGRLEELVSSYGGSAGEIGKCLEALLAEKRIKCYISQHGRYFSVND
jgi:wyosine [tRNA(Phe)-imidazoG37] synthetase (radical SAM superfamily)